MKTIVAWLRSYLFDVVAAWNRFWFTPGLPQTLAIIRICAGSLIFYTHFVWSLELRTFFGPDSIIPGDYRSLLVSGQSCAWSHFDWLPSEAWLWPVHLTGLVVMLLFTAGAFSRITGLLTALLVISYANRATGALFGLDQVNAMLALYLAISPCGDCYSVDRWRLKRQGRGGEPVPKVMTNIAIRLMQLHLCLIYLFAGIGKLQGVSWWNGQAIWGAFASYEYQTLDMTFLASQMWLINLLTWTAVAWETCYPFIVWSRLGRPVMLGLALLVHLGIGLAMGMMTFGLAMIIANLAFVPPELWKGRGDARLPRTLESAAG